MEKPCKHGHAASERYRSADGRLHCRSCRYLRQKKYAKEKRVEDNIDKTRKKHAVIWPQGPGMEEGEE